MSAQEAGDPAERFPAANAKRAGTARRERLADRRRALGLTQEDLAARLGVDRSTVIRWEHSETAPLPWLRPRLARVLRVSGDQLTELLGSSSDAASGGIVPGPRTGQLDSTDPGDSARGETAAAAGRARVVVPRQLPGTAADFTGRSAELAALSELLDQADGSAPGTVAIAAIGGTAGVGKTALTLHWAHQVADRFPDGQLHVNLSGFGPASTPVPPGEAVRGFLDALGVPPERIPSSPDAQAGLFRSVLAGKRMLVVLDNARDEQQVRPLLPATAGSLVVVTSRNHLAGLATSYGARLLSLDVLSHSEAVTLLTARIGASRCAAEPEATAEIAASCAYLPLALAVAAARATARPRFPLAALAAELRDTARRPETLDADDPATSVRTVFSWSYRQLPAAAARMFRLVGLHPGPDISVPAAASLAAVSRQEASRLLHDLTRAHLLAEHVPGRYSLHDLLRAYAAACAGESESPADRGAATGRVLDHYLHTTARAALLVRAAHDPVRLPPPSPGTAPEELSHHQQALAWFEAEHKVLLAAVALADGNGFNRHAWQLPWALMPFLRRSGRWQEWAATQRTALAAATRAGDAAGQALAGRLLANACDDLGDYDQALGHYLTSLERFRGLADRRGEAKTLEGLGVLAARQGRYADALAYDEQALGLYRAAGLKAEEAIALYGVGWDHGLLGDFEQARAFCQRALTLNAETGNRDVDAAILDSLGYAEHHLGNLTSALACYERALALLREFGDRRREAVTLTHLGDSHWAAGDRTPARDAWRQALAILENLGHPDADKVRGKLADQVRAKPFGIDTQPGDVPAEGTAGHARGSGPGKLVAAGRLLAYTDARIGHSGTAGHGGGHLGESPRRRHPCGAP